MHDGICTSYGPTPFDQLSDQKRATGKTCQPRPVAAQGSFERVCLALQLRAQPKIHLSSYLAVCTSLRRPGDQDEETDGRWFDAAENMQLPETHATRMPQRWFGNISGGTNHPLQRGEGVCEKGRGGENRKGPKTGYTRWDEME